ncbi:hypothetical protein MRX96_014950 [Rhipicephalus microplus]
MMQSQLVVSVDELICTVSETAVFEKMVPPDGLCHYVYYTSVVISKGYVTAPNFDVPLPEKLSKLNSENVKHYGVLNALAASGDLKSTYNKAKGIPWLIAYSSVGWIERPSECFSHAPSIFDKSKYNGEAAKEADRAPDILTVSRMMTKDKKYKGRAKMGLSFELGTLVYHLKAEAVNLDMVNAACHGMYVTSLDIVPCRLNVHFLRAEVFQGVNLGEVQTQKTTALLFEDDKTITEKCNQLARKSTNLRKGMALLLVNSHLGDFSADSPCKGQGEKDREDPFWRIKVIKSELKIP